MRTGTLMAASVALLWIAAPVHAQETGAAQQHEVREGDTLWDLAQLYYENPWLWQRIFEANTDVVEDPHWIYPAERLVIPGLAEDFPADRRPVGPAGPGPAQRQTAARQPTRTRFYRQPTEQVEVAEQPTILAEESRTPASVRPGDFYAAPWLSDFGDMQVVGRLVRTGQSVSVSWRSTEATQPYDIVYLSYESRDEPAVGDQLLLVSLGRWIGGYGWVVQPAAFLEVQALEPEVMVAQVVKQFSAVTTGAMAIPMESFPEPLLPQAEPVEEGAQGEIIAFENEQNLYGMETRAFLDLGAEDGIQIGDELVAARPERRTGGFFGQMLPSEIIAELRVIRVRERTSTVRVFNLTKPTLEPGLPVRVVKKMP